MNILMMTHRLPFPPDKGERIRGYYWLKTLCAKHEVDLLTLTQEAVVESYQRELEKMVRSVEAVPLEARTFLPRLGSAILRGESLTQAFFGSKTFSRVLREKLSGGHYDLCLALCSSMGAYALAAIRHERLIVDLVDVDSAKWQQYGRKHRGVERWVFDRESRKIAELERKLSMRAELCVTVSRRECELLDRVAPGAKSLAIPNGVDTAFFSPPELDDRLDRLVFVGQMDYFPNVDAVIWFAEKVWPEISNRYPKLRWNIVGRNPAKKVRQLGRLPNVQVTGAVPDIRPFLRSAISIAPIQIACGVQNKVLEAMSAARAVVAFAAVAEGLNVRPQYELLVAQTPKEWFLALDLLLSDRTLARTLGTHARQAMLDRYTWQQTADRMLSAVGQVQTPSREHSQPIPNPQLN
jgi:polysaccharide biosynthesis protein PslH